MKKLRPWNAAAHISSAINKNPFFFCVLQREPSASAANTFLRGCYLLPFKLIWMLGERFAGWFFFFFSYRRCIRHVPSIYLSARRSFASCENFRVECEHFGMRNMQRARMFRCLKQTNATICFDSFESTWTVDPMQQNRSPSVFSQTAGAINEHGGYGEWMIHAFDARCPLHDRSTATNRHEPSALCVYWK